MQVYSIPITMLQILWKSDNKWLRYSKIGSKILNRLELTSQSINCMWFPCIGGALEHPIAGVHHRSVWLGLIFPRRPSHRYIGHGIYILLAGKLFNFVKNIFFIQKHLKYGDLNIRIPIPIDISYRSNLLLSHIDEKLIAKKCRICVGLLVLFDLHSCELRFTKSISRD